MIVSAADISGCQVRLIALFEVFFGVIRIDQFQRFSGVMLGQHAGWSVGWFSVDCAAVRRSNWKKVGVWQVARSLLCALIVFADSCHARIERSGKGYSDDRAGQAGVRRIIIPDERRIGSENRSTGAQDGLLFSRRSG